MGWLEDTWNKVVENSKKNKAARKREKARKEAERAVTGQNRFDQWLTGVVGGGVARRNQRQASKNEVTYYVDPREYQTTTDPKTGITRLSDGTRVFKGDPLYFDYSSEIQNYIRNYGIPSNWKSLGDHWDQVPIPASIGVGKDLRQSTAVKQKWILMANNPNTLAKLYTINRAQKAFAEQMLNYAKGGSTAVEIATHTLDVAASSPVGMILKIFKWQTDLILKSFEAQIEEVDIENGLIRQTLANQGINVENRIKQLINIAKNEDWELYNYQDLQRPKTIQISSSSSGGNQVPSKPQEDTFFTTQNIALIGVGAVALYVFTTREK